MYDSSFQKVMNDFFEEAVREAEKRILARFDGSFSNTDTMLDVSEVSKMFGISDQTLYSMCRQKKIPHRKFGSRVVFSSNALEKWGREQDELNYRKE
ncbi:helix-turn-helix domain-containing protein [Paenibacillus sp. D2_2]|uniref:helix-turn-helix domain-containing protein n=1 Tax=Paenibacillus sp. D2_2 TaxID=3073092 RepID=UPI002815D8E7|nr:helix-turn-helix domain-containing protein [Paenibacillus sp. D2_2]WMT42796.1 helix-turn-helix domain-containing protein [Paenibacillus sp. D2_2]